MKLGKIALTIGALGLLGVALADEEVKRKMVMEIVGDSGDDEVRIELDSDELGFDLHDLQEGETRSIVDKEGRTILVSRDTDGFTFDVEGKSIKMPFFDGGHHGAVWVSDQHGEDVDVHVRHDRKFVTAESMDGIMIMSGKPIDEATQQAIKALLESAGHGSEVHFIDHKGPHHKGPHGGPPHVKVIQKRVVKD
ncbi:MAG: hypothetical protein OEQ14_05075 [Gammaproteobacteria bacterium]|nr:hypothetical protein [Gammaproteobacteria bacterium]